jgi:hypothetical protein
MKVSSERTFLIARNAIFHSTPPITVFLRETLGKRVVKGKKEKKKRGLAALRGWLT